MHYWLSEQAWRDLGVQLLHWLGHHILTLDTALQFGLLAMVLVASAWLGRQLRRLVAMTLERWPLYPRLSAFIEELARPMAALLLLWLLVAALAYAEQAAGLLEVAASLLGAWVLIRLASGLIRNEGAARGFAIVTWSVVALNILGLLGPLVAAMQAAGITLGGTRLSVYGVVMALVTAVLLLWGAMFLSRVGEEQVDRLTGVNPSLRVLFAKVLRFSLLTAAVLMALSSAGIDLTAFAVFSGALGVGIGFGLQKVVSNFVSGVILLLDRSIKPGDVIEIADTYGWINKLAARYTSVVTRDGTEYLIPNEDMITQQVINWSHSDRNVRRRIGVAVAYDCDIKRAMRLMEQAARAIPRVLDKPEPRTLLRGFGSDGVDLELRFWINDPYNGVSNVASEVMEQIWDLFHAEGIHFPYPQRDIHFSKEAMEALKALRASGKTE